MATAVAANPTEPRVVNRWVQMIAGVFAMMAIANLQYAWTLFTKPLTQNLHATLAAVQVAFAAFIIAETWLVPFEGYLIDRLGPRRVIAIGGVLVALGWIGSGYASSLHQLYFWYVTGGVGAGAVYGGTIGNSLKWFPDHRGLCAGFTSGAYGIGTALTVAPIAAMIKNAGYQKTFITWGFIQGAVVIIAAMFIVAPPKGWVPKGWTAAEALAKVKVRTSTYDMTHWQMLKTPAFYVIYIMMTLVAFGGLVVTAQIAPIARHYNVDKVIIAWGMSALVIAIEVDRILNGITRPFWGWVSDHIGRENTMFIAFMCEAMPQSSPCCIPSAGRSGSSCCRACASSPGARSSRSSPPSPVTCSARNGLRPTMALSTRPKVWPPSLPDRWPRWPVSRPGRGFRSSTPWFSVTFWRLCWRCSG